MHRGALRPSLIRSQRNWYVAMARKSNTPAIDKYELVANKIVELLDKEIMPWRKPWHSTPYMNLVGGNLYSGRNPLYCAIDCLINGWDETYFVGFSQGKSIGWQLAKGSKSTWIRFGGTGSKEVEDKETGKLEKTFYGLHKWHNVFHVNFWDDSEADVKKADLIAKHAGKYPQTFLSDPKPEQLQKFVDAQGADISHGGNACFYLPEKDAIRMAPYESFTSANAYYSTQIHELGHWTGNSKRLGRDLSGKQGSEQYAKEELVAEFTSAFVCNQLGITSELEQHASYLKYWRSIIKADPKALFKAMDQASAASDLLLSNAGLVKETESKELVAA